MATPSSKSTSVPSYNYDLSTVTGSTTPYWKTVDPRMHPAIVAAHEKEYDYLFVVYQFILNGTLTFRHARAKDLPKDFLTQGRVVFPSSKGPTSVVCQKVHFFIISYIEDIGRHCTTWTVGDPLSLREFVDLFQTANGLDTLEQDRYVSEEALTSHFLEMGKPVEHLHYRKRAALHGDCTSISFLAEWYEHGYSHGGIECVPRDSNQAFQWAKYGAEGQPPTWGPDIECQLLLASYYRVGFGTAIDPKAAFHWMFKAATFTIGAEGSKGDEVEQAQFELGGYFENGIGTEKDLVSAFKWYLLSATHDYYKAQCRVGVCYYEGIGTSYNFLEAKKWFDKCADRDEDGEANYYLGRLHYTGWGKTPDSHATALKHFRKAKELGYSLPPSFDKLCPPTFPEESKEERKK